MLEHDIEQLPSLNELLDYLNPERIDLVLVEGFKEIEINKLFLFRKQIKNKILELDTTISRLMNEPHTLAVVTDLSAEEITPHLQTEKPILNINEVSSIADFIQHYIKTEAQHD
jgi:molybdopterin-guanine dinucleotide biosynthesis protein MobB